MKLEEFIIDNKLSEKDTYDVIDFIWWKTDVYSKELKLDLSFQLFENSPSYTVPMHLKWQYDILTETEKSYFWDKYRFYLSSDKKEHREQIEYSLWVDFFEDIEICQEVWKKLILENPTDILYERILPCSGPVSYENKEELYLKLIGDVKWHELILVSLIGSFFDVYGQLNIQKARLIFQKLKVNFESNEYKEFKEVLYKFETKKEYWDSIIIKK